ncbi:hypothetical protein C0J52_21456 [Blattella germanica]|nr:hypothetical protein C0J52_21456 [Blattella germanica]
MYLIFTGDIDDDEEILDWLTDPENMELTDHIERVNRKMFQKIRQTSDFIAVFFYSDDCKQCGRVLAEIEHIDDEADGAGINFVKIDDKQMAKEFGVFALPAVVFFKMGSKEPVIYAESVFYVEKKQSRPKKTVWCGITTTNLVDPYLLCDTMNVEQYFEMLQDYIWPMVSELLSSSKTMHRPILQMSSVTGWIRSLQVIGWGEGDLMKDLQEVRSDTQ